MKLFLKILLGFILLIALAIAGLWVATQNSNSLGPEATPLQQLDTAGLQAALDGLREEQKLVGLASKVFVADRLVAEAASGWKTVEETTPLNADDLFHVGSLGKSMSATVIAQLVESGQMSWTDTIGERLSTIPHAPSWSDLTLEHLLTHRAGLPRPPLSYMINEVTEPERLSEIRREVAEKLMEDPASSLSGTIYSYSNTGYMMASLMAEEATGQAWETLVQTYLFDRLFLETAGFGAPTGDAPFGHLKTGPFKFMADPEEGQADNPPWMAAAGTLHMSLNDLQSFGRIHLNAGKAEGSILSEETFTKLHTPILQDYAYGWIVEDWIIEDQTVPVIWHNGSNTMWYALMVLVPDYDAIVILASNDGSNLRRAQSRFDALARDIIKELTLLED